MNRIAKRFQELREKKQAAFIPFITGGDPTLAMSEDIAVTLGENGADIIEYGAPFSDPVGDGPVIQEASLRALKQGVNLRAILASIERIRKRSNTPLMIFTYYNPVFVYGIESFARDAANAGADGVLCVDLPPDYALEYRDVMQQNDMSTVFLAAPTSTDERLSLIGNACDTFVYYISRTILNAIRSFDALVMASIFALVVGYGKPVTEPAQRCKPCPRKNRQTCCCWFRHFHT